MDRRAFGFHRMSRCRVEGIDSNGRYSKPGAYPMRSPRDSQRSRARTFRRVPLRELRRSGDGPGPRRIRSGRRAGAAAETSITRSLTPHAALALLTAGNARFVREVGHPQYYFSDHRAPTSAPRPAFGTPARAYLELGVFPYRPGVHLRQRSWRPVRLPRRRQLRQ